MAALYLVAPVISGCMAETMAPHGDPVDNTTCVQQALADETGSAVVMGAPPRIIHLNFSTAGTCRFGTLEECRRKIQGLLDSWYADFNVVFTHDPPELPAGQYYRVDITFSGSGGTGVATASCNDQFGRPQMFARANVGGNLVSNAGTIAQENAHNVGLAHTRGPTDVMNQAANANSAGFTDMDLPTYGTSCRTVQNSYRMMLERLGPWPGGCKPGPFGEFCPGMARPPVASPADAGTVVDAGATRSDVAPSSTPEEDARTSRPPLPRDAGTAYDAGRAPTTSPPPRMPEPARNGGADASMGMNAPGAQTGGCSAGRGAPGSWGATLMAMFFAAMLRRGSRRRCAKTHLALPHQRP